MRIHGVVSLMGMILVWVTASSQAAAPSNDSFANRTPLSGSPVIGMATTVDATREPFEPTSFFGTVWWTWAAPIDSSVTISTEGTDYNSALVVFTGDTIDTLKFVTEASNSSVVFPAKAGMVFQIMVGSVSNGDAGNVVLAIKASPPLITSPVVVGSNAAANDDFASRQPLSGATVSGFGYNPSATRETFEPPNTGYQTLWWSWIAPANGELSADTNLTTYGAILSVFTGGDISSLTPLAASDASPYAKVILPVTAGTEYEFAIGYGGVSGFGVNYYSVLNLDLTSTSAGASVSIVATGDASAVEGGEASKIKVIRTGGDTSAALVVRYKVTGAVKAGVDYSALSGVVTIPAGATQAKIKLKAINDHTHEGTRIAKIKLKAASDGSYTLGSPVVAKVKIIDND